MIAVASFLGDLKRRDLGAVPIDDDNRYLKDGSACGAATTLQASLMSVGKHAVSLSGLGQSRGSRGNRRFRLLGIVFGRVMAISRDCRDQGPGAVLTTLAWSARSDDLANIIE